MVCGPLRGSIPPSKGCAHSTATKLQQAMRQCCQLKLPNKPNIPSEPLIHRDPDTLWNRYSSQGAPLKSTLPYSLIEPQRPLALPSYALNNTFRMSSYHDYWQLSLVRQRLATGRLDDESCFLNPYFNGLSLANRCRRTGQDRRYAPNVLHRAHQ